MSQPSSEPIPTASEARERSDETQPGIRSQRPGMLRTLIRFSIGGTLLAVEAMTNQLQQWEQKSAQIQTEREKPESVLIPADEWEPTLLDTPGVSARYTLLGLVFASQSRLDQAGAALRRTGDAVGRRMDRALQPLRTSRILAPLRDRAQPLAERGRAQVNRWRELGRTEEAISRALTHTALNQLIESSMDQVVDDPRVQLLIQELVQDQGLGLVDEVVEEVRERTVTGDMLLERFVRSVLRRPPRESLPAPTAIIDKLAKSRTKGRG